MQRLFYWRMLKISSWMSVTKKRVMKDGRMMRFLLFKMIKNVDLL